MNTYNFVTLHIAQQTRQLTGEIDVFPILDSTSLMGPIADRKFKILVLKLLKMLSVRSYTSPKRFPLIR